MKKTKLLLYIVALLAAFRAESQTYLMNNTPVTDCEGAFYDSGGGSGNYGNNQNFTKKFCADGTVGTHIQLNFSGVELAPGDDLCFYDGPNASAPQLSCSSDFPPGEPFIVQATAQNPSGCLTVTFNSNGSGTGAGWAAAIKCVAACQTVLADLVSTTPALVPADTGWIDVCPDERIFLSGRGEYPQNGIVYQQSDFNTTFEWNFGDGAIGYGTNTSHRFTEPGGYYIQLLLTDTFKCRSTNLLNLRVRVAPRPNFDLSNANTTPICAGDTIHLNSSVNGNNGAALIATPDTSNFAIEGIRSDSLPLPDGNGQSYETSIFFTEFSPGQVVTSASDIESICVNMEHSWMRDMRIKLTCPNGDTIGLHNFAGQTGGSVFLGEPNDTDTGLNPIPGVGYDYCWTANATNGTWLQYANTVLGGSGTLPPGDYSPVDPFDDLIGCPLNGEWKITVTDLWAYDNGYIFSWSIKIKEELYPSIEAFSPQFVNWGWNPQPTIYYQSQDSIAATPQNAGTANFTFSVTDEFGCTWNEPVNIPVLPPTHPDCHSCNQAFTTLRDTAVCAGSAVELNAVSLLPPQQEVRFEAFPDYAFGYANHPPLNPYASALAVNSMGYNFLTDPINQITEVCLDLETDFDADIQLYLRSPDGKILELSTGNGGSGDNYKTTCFSPTAITPIVGQTAPFNGTYQPEGNWTSLSGAVVNGDWQLLAADNGGPTKMGRLKGWNIGFVFNNSFSYDWTNSASLSCDFCPAPVAMPAATTNYVVSITDAFGCLHLDTATVDISTVFPAPTNIDFINQPGGVMTWTWTPVQGATGYEVQIDGGPWEPANGMNAHSVTGLATGQFVLFKIRAAGGTPSCVPDEEQSLGEYFECVLDAYLNSTVDALCYGAPTGTAYISVSNANVPVSYFANGLLPAYANGDLVNIFPAGNHFVIVADATACQDTVYFTIGEPGPISIAATSMDAICNGQPSGSVAATAMGGVGSFNYNWETCAGAAVGSSAMLPNLEAGCYRVTVSDGNGCSGTATTTIGQPTALQVIKSQTGISCNGLSDGSATIMVSGGTTPYQYLWDNGQTTATSTGLNGGFHTVYITDFAGCLVVELIEIQEPMVLVVDSIAVKSATCFGNSNGSATAFAAGGVTPYQYIWSDGQTTQKANNLMAGSYTVTITDAHNCTMTSVATVTSPAALSVGFSQVTNEKCAGDCSGTATVAPTGGTMPYDYVWSVPSVPPGAAMAQNLCPGSYFVTVTDARGCTKDSKVDIGAATALEVRFTETPPACQGLTNGQVVTEVTGGASPYQYLWANGETVANIQNLPCGNIDLTVTDALGCISTQTAQLDCPVTVQVQSIIAQPVKCFGDANGRITVQALGGSGTYTYAWSDPLSQVNATAMNLAVGTYTVTVRDVNGCSTTASASVLQPDPLGTLLLRMNVTCFGGNDGSLVVLPTGGTPDYTYQWNTGVNDQTLANIAAGNYTVTVKDANGCTATLDAELQQPAMPLTAQAIQTKQSCFGQQDGAALATAAGGNGQPYLFNWNNGQQGGAISGLSPGLYLVVVSDTKGCTTLQSVQIQEYTQINLLVSFVPPACHDGTDGKAALSSISGGAGLGDTTQYQYTWSVPGAANSTFIGQLSGDQNYTLTATDMAGCTGEYSFYLSEPPAIQMQIAKKDISCFGIPDGSITVSSTQNAQLPVQYLWSNNATTSQIVDIPAGTYKLTLRDAKGCTSTVSTQLTQPDALAVAFETRALTCHGDQDALIKTTVSGGTPEYRYEWSNGSTTVYLGGLAAGTYTVTLTDSNGCTLENSASITEPDSLAITADLTEPACFGQKNGRIKLFASGGKIPYRYSMNGGDFVGSSSFIGLGSGFYQFEVRDGNGCITHFSDSLMQPLPLDVTIEADTALILGDTLVLMALVENAIGLTAFEWKSKILESIICLDSLCSSAWTVPAFPNRYTVVATDENGCTGTAFIDLALEKPRGVYVPTGFSPNGDFNNDLLMVHGKSEQVLQIRTFRVYDRWGERMYEDGSFKVNDTTRGWDGRFRGKDCDPGVYVWVLEVEYRDGFIEVLHGNSTLIR